jgi:hypothetical protein
MPAPEQHPVEQNWFPDMTRLARTFPTLRDARWKGRDALDPFEPERLIEWARAHASFTAWLSVRFVLAVYSGSVGQIGVPARVNHMKNSQPYRCAVGLDLPVQPFDVVDALAHWDAEHREAFLAWARAPWWP